LLALHIPQTEKAVLRTRSVGRSGAPSEETREKIFNFFPFEPFNPLIISRCYFLKTEQKRKSGKDCRFLFRKNADVHWFYAPFLAHFQIVSFRLFNYHAPPSINIMTQNPTHLCDFLA